MMLILTWDVCINRMCDSILQKSQPNSNSSDFDMNHDAIVQFHLRGFVEAVMLRQRWRELGGAILDKELPWWLRQ